MGRFITADPTIQRPYDPQDFNRYAYCRNNPIKYIDPTGYGFWSWMGKLIGAVAGAVAGYFGGPAVGMAVYSAISSGISAMASGANVFQAMGVALVSGVAGYAGGALGSAYGGAIGAGSWGTSLLSGMFAGAAGGAAGAAMTRGNVGMGALSGTAAGATMGAFSGIGGRLGDALGPMFGMPLAGVAGAAVRGGNLGEGALAGAAAWYGQVTVQTIANATDNWKHRALLKKQSKALSDHAINYLKNKENLTTDESIYVFAKNGKRISIWDRIKAGVLGGTDAAGPGGTPWIQATETAGAMAAHLPTTINAQQGKYDDHGDITGEYDNRNPYYGNMGVMTRDGKSYRQRMDDR